MEEEYDYSEFHSDKEIQEEYDPYDAQSIHSDEPLEYTEDSSANFEISKSGNKDSNLELNLPASRYDSGNIKPISEQSSEESPSQHPKSSSQIKIQEERLAKAQNALNKLKTEEATKRGKKPVPAKSEKKLPAKKPAPITKPKTIVKSKQPESLMGFQVESVQKATESAAPGANPVSKLNISQASSNNNNLSKSLQKKQEEIKREEAHKQSMSNIRGFMNDNKSKAQKEMEDMMQLQKNLLQREREYKQTAPPEKREKTAPPPPPVPQPRNLGENLYKLHQLAENEAGKSKLSAASLSGSMLQAIKHLTSMVSEELIVKEVQEEIKKADKCEIILSSGKDCMRGEVDYHEETRKLTRRYKLLLQEQLELNNVRTEEVKKQMDLKEKIKILEPTKAVVKLNNGKYIRAGMMPQLGVYDTIEKLEDVTADIMKENPLDVVIDKIEKQGATIQDIFNQLDSDNDKVLTLAEIRDGLPRIQVKLTDEDKKLMIKALDSNSDGVVSLEEFTTILNPKLNVQKEYRAIVGNLDINNPIVFEEEILDMRLRGRMLKKDLPGLISRLSVKLPSEKKLVQQIKDLEKLLADRNVRRSSDNSAAVQLQDQVKKYSEIKTQVFEEVENEVSTQALQVSQLKEKLNAKNVSSAQLNSHVNNLKNQLDTSSTKKQHLAKMEDKLDKENRFIAIIIIQAGIKRFLNRIRYRKEKLRRRVAARVISRSYKKYKEIKEQQQTQAATKIQNAFRMKKAINLKNQLKQDKQAVGPNDQSLNQSQTVSHQEDLGYNCEKCNSQADRLCKLCRSHYCPDCFSQYHQSESHLFFLLSSCYDGNFSLNTSHLSAAELDAIVDITDHLRKRRINIYEFLQQYDQSSSGEIDLDVLKQILYSRELAFDSTHIANLLLIAQRYEDSSHYVDYYELCALFCS